jgi:hypothetical protein
MLLISFLCQNREIYIKSIPGKYTVLDILADEIAVVELGIHAVQHHNFKFDLSKFFNKSDRSEISKKSSISTSVQIV